MDKVKVWRCGGGHALGMVVRGGRELLLFREAMRADNGLLSRIKRIEEDEEENEMEVMAVVVGRVVDVRCSICGRMRTWVE